MIQIEELCEKASKVLLDHGVGTFVIIAKCPDSDKIGFNKQGNKLFLMGSMDVVKIIIQGEVLNPTNIFYKNNDSDKDKT